MNWSSPRVVLAIYFLMFTLSGIIAPYNVALEISPEGARQNFEFITILASIMAILLIYPYVFKLARRLKK